MGAVRLNNNAVAGIPSYTQTDDLNEQTIATFSGELRPRWFEIDLDVTTLTQNSTVRFYGRVDGTNYISSDTNDGRLPYAFTVASDADHLIIGPYLISGACRVTIQAGGAEGASRALPWTSIENIC